MASEPARGPAAAGLSHQATLWLSEAKAEVLFGKLGTHCHLAGAQLQLKDKFLNTRMGRKLVVFAASRQVAGNAIKAVLFQLSHDLNVARGGGAGGGGLEPLEQSEWSYYAPSGSGEEGEKKGPYKYKKMRNWLDKEQMPGSFAVQHSRTGMWVPLWYLGVASGQAEANGQADEEMVDCAPDASEQLVAEVQQHREGQDMSQLSAALPAFLDLAGPEGAEAMDYDVSGPDEEQLGGARVFVVVDTNILLSHLNFLERTMNDFAGAATQASHLGEPAVEVKLVVPYAVISELDGLKMRQEGDLKKRARHAIKRLSELRSERDTWVLLQSVAEHHAVVESAPVKEGADDIILQTAVLYQSTYVVNEQRMRHASATFLLSNDRALLLKAQGAGVHSFTAQSFPRRPSQLEQAVRRMDQGVQANGHEGGMPQQQQTQQEAQEQQEQQAQEVQQQQQQQQQQQHVAHSPLASPQSSGSLPGLQQQIPGSPHNAAIAAAPHLATHHQQHQHQQQQQHAAATLAQQQEARMLQLAAQQQQQQQHVEQQQQLRQEEARMLQLAAQQQHMEQQQQRQQAQLAEQLRQLQMTAHGAQAPAHQQAAHHKGEQLAAAMHALVEEHRSAWAVLEQAGAQQVEVVVHMIASRVGIEPQRLMLERELWLVGQAPLSTQLGQALAMFQELAVRYQQQQAAALRQQQEQQQQQQRQQQQQQQHQAVAALQQAAAVQQAALQQTLAGPTQQQQLQMLAALQARGFAAGEAGLAAAASPGGSPQQYQQLQQQLSLGAAQHSGELQQQLSLGVAQRSGELQMPQVHEAAALGRQRSGQQQALVAGRQQAVAPDAAAQAALVLRRLQAAGMDLRGVLHQLSDIVAQGVAPIVIYHLQQELGIGWDSKGEYDNVAPAWDGAQTLSTICNRANTFCWDRQSVLQRSWIERDRKSGRLAEMERFLSRGRSDRRPPPTHADLLAAARDVLDLLHNFQATADMPHDDPPNPAEITHFVSLGEAKAALQEGVRRCQALLALLDPQGAPAP